MHPNSACFSSIRRVPRERWKGRWRFDIAWISDQVVDHLVANDKASRIGDRVILAVVPSDASVPQRLQNPLHEEILAVVRALAKLRARIDHEAEIARRSVQARATEPSA